RDALDLISRSLPAAGARVPEIGQALVTMCNCFATSDARSRIATDFAAITDLNSARTMQLEL
ncbi:MAG: hypothetical protein V4460_14875, partial [Pseudomonadota bacterium]